MAVTRRWTPQRFVTLRHIRVITCIATTSIALAGPFVFTARKSVALNINGRTTQVTTYAMTATRLLEEQGMDIKTHDIVTTSSDDQLANHAVITVQSAYRTIINIDGMSAPFWTVATSTDQLLGSFGENQNNAIKIIVDIDNVYNQPTGGLVINQDGPVTVTADGKISMTPDDRLPAASVLDSKGIVLNKEDRVDVEKNGDTTILHVRRITRSEETRTAVVPYSTQTIIDSNLPEGQSEIRQQGVNGEKTQVYNVTYVDDMAESETLESETVTTMTIDWVITVGAAKSNTDKGSDKKSDSADNDEADSGSNNQHESSGNNTNNTGDKNNSSSDNNINTDTNNSVGNTGGSNSGNTGNTSNTGGGADNNPGSSGSDPGTATTPSGRLWHATIARAQTYAAGATAQRGWTGNDWDCLVKLWTRESSWLRYAENTSSGAYGIPQSLPAGRMATFGANYRDDAAVRIDWGLWYIAQAYGSPFKAWRHSEQVGWY